jgi:hypothetical protein
MALKIDSARGVLLIEIRPRRGGKVLSLFFALMLLCAGAVVFGASLIDSIWNASGAIVYQSSGLFLFTTAAIAHLYSFAELLFGRDTVEVNSTSLKIRSAILGRVSAQREFSNGLVRNLSYGIWSTDRGDRSGIRFEYQSEPFIFAKYSSEEDAWAVIDAMCRVYKFSTPEPDKGPGVIDWSKALDRE